MSPGGRQIGRAFTMVELLVALGMIAMALIPVAYSFTAAQARLRGLYVRAVAEQALDGYREILANGQWRHLPVGRSKVQLPSEAVARLPAGECWLEVSDLEDGRRQIAMAWDPGPIRGAGRIRKELVVQR